MHTADLLHFTSILGRWASFPVDSGSCSLTGDVAFFFVKSARAHTHTTHTQEHTHNGAFPIEGLPKRVCPRSCIKTEESKCKWVREPRQSRPVSHSFGLTTSSGGRNARHAHSRNSRCKNTLRHTRRSPSAFPRTLCNPAHATINLRCNLFPASCKYPGNNAVMLSFVCYLCWDDLHRSNQQALFFCLWWISNDVTEKSLSLENIHLFQIVRNIRSKRLIQCSPTNVWRRSNPSCALCGNVDSAP